MLPSRGSDQKARYVPPSCSGDSLRDRLAMPSNSACALATSSGLNEEGAQVKEELKQAIQARRVNQGLNALPLPIKQEAKTTYELTPEEQSKIKRRRERNKMAAWRCREKKKQRLDDLEREANQLEQNNNDLAREIASLRAEVNTLTSDLRTHRCLLGKGVSSKNYTKPS